MDTSQYLSDFQLVGTVIKKLHLDNTFVHLTQDEETINDVSVSYQVQKINPNATNGLIGTLDLTVDVSSRREKENLHASLIIQGCFTTTDDDQSHFKKMLEINGASTLYTITRSLILSVTALSVQGDQMILPMVNFIEMSNN